MIIELYSQPRLTFVCSSILLVYWYIPTYQFSSQFYRFISETVQI